MADNTKIFSSDNFNAMRWGTIFTDLLSGLKLWRIWMMLSWQEFRSTYRRSIFGVLWVIAAFAGFVFVKLIIFSALIPTEDGKTYNMFLTIGLYVWMYFLLVVNSAPATFTGARGWISSEPLPYSVYVFKNIMRELYNLGLTFLVVIAATIYIGYATPVKSLYAIFAVLFYIVNAVWIKFLFGIIGARFRDIGHFINAVTLPMMFLTPIFWTPEQMPNIMKYVWWNPFYHYIEIFRAPIITGALPMESWMFVLTLFGIGTAATIVLYARFSRRIVFWL